MQKDSVEDQEHSDISVPKRAIGNHITEQQGDGRAAFLRRRRRNNWLIAFALFAFCAAVFAWFVYRTAIF